MQVHLNLDHRKIFYHVDFVTVLPDETLTERLLTSDTCIFPGKEAEAFEIDCFEVTSYFDSSAQKRTSLVITASAQEGFYTIVKTTKEFIDGERVETVVTLGENFVLKSVK